MELKKLANVPIVGPAKLSVGTKSPTPIFLLKSTPSVGAGVPYITNRASCFLVGSPPAHSITASLILEDTVLSVIHSANWSVAVMPGIPIRPAITK